MCQVLKITDSSKITNNNGAVGVQASGGTVLC